MIDLSRNRAELLAEIGAVEPTAEPLSDLTDPRVAATDVHVSVHGHAKDDLFPLLKLVLSERFAAVSRPQLLGDLLIPLRNALGNAYKHGNARNAAGTVCVEIVLTRNGALITVTDEGSGFDVALTFRRFQEQEDYCENRGAGFRNLHRARSTVSYENGGRTLLLCFRPTIPAAEQPVAPALLPPEPARRPLTPSLSPNGGEGVRRTGEGAVQGLKTRSSLSGNSFHGTEGRAGCPQPAASVADISSGLRRGEDTAPYLDPRRVQTCLAAESPEFNQGQARIESCRVYATGGPADDGCGNRYVLRVAGCGGGREATRIFTGRHHATEAAAATDFEAAKKLHDAAVSNRLVIPRPVARLTGEPRLVLYDFDPWMNLREYLTYRSTSKALRHSAERIGRGLAHLHRSRVVFGWSSNLSLSPSTLKHGLQPGENFNAMVARAEKNLETLPVGPEPVNLFHVCAERIQEWAATRRQCIVAPIHGALDWDCIHYSADGRFYLYRFEMCRQSDPGLDLGGFAADLLCFTLARHDEEACRTSLDTFLSNYNAEAEQPMEENDLRFYIALALVESLGRSEPLAREEVGPRFEALDIALGRSGALATSEVSS